ncbi:MAG: transcriptional regulator GlxA family with amidase domain [Saprospiraceae bacterium]|jgi:transcriptional regulator GlxA family with amidase domain
MRTIGILLFDEVEILDFAGPYEVFSIARDLSGIALFDVKTISVQKSTIHARNGLSINTDYNFSNCPSFDILVIPGGFGTRPLLNDREVMEWIEAQYKKVEIVMTVCTGSLLIGKLGLLDHLPYCTHHKAYNEMKKIAPTAIPQKERRYIQTGKIFSSGGISAGIDLAFHLLEQLHSKTIAMRTAEYMEYRLV